MQDVESVGTFSLSQVYWYMIVYVVAQGVHFLFTRFTPWFSKAEMIVQRNCVCYVVEVVITFPILVLQLYYGWSALQEKMPTQHDSDMIIFATVMLCSLYLFEIGYKARIGLPLLAHHVITVAFMMLTFWRMGVEPRLFVLKGAVLLGMTATTEQQSFIALFFFRVKYFSLKTVAYMFYFSAVSTFVVKAILIAFTTDAWARNSTLFWWIVYPPVVTGLFVTQIWGAWILWKLGDRLMLKHKASLPTHEMGDRVPDGATISQRIFCYFFKKSPQRKMSIVNESQATISMYDVEQDIENMSRSYY